MSAQDIDRKGEAEPKIYEKAAEKADARPRECLAVEDTDKGIKSAQRSGTNMIGLKGTEGQSCPKCDSKDIDSDTWKTRRKLLMQKTTST